MVRLEEWANTWYDRLEQVLFKFPIFAMSVLAALEFQASSTESATQMLITQFHTEIALLVIF